jgi:hypothetical protein
MAKRKKATARKKPADRRQKKWEVWRDEYYRHRDSVPELAKALKLLNQQLLSMDDPIAVGFIWDLEEIAGCMAEAALFWRKFKPALKEAGLLVTPGYDWPAQDDD